MFSLIKGLTLSQDELDQYYIQKRKRHYEKYGAVPKFIKLHNFLHWLLLPCIMLLRKIGGIKLTVVCDERVKTHEPIVYACTHIGGVDIETAFEVIKKPCWLFLGDPREVYKNIDGFMLGLNGVICLDSKDKDDRRIAKETAIGLLQNGGSLMIFPEGAWNISVNQPVMGLFAGTADIAIQSGAQIVPIALECYGKHMYAAIGKNIKIAGVWEDKYELTNHLRDALATLKWRIFDSVGVQKRSDIPENYRQIFIDSIINDNKDTSYTEQDVIDTMFRDRNIATYEDVYAHLNNITPTMDNAFLFNKEWR